MHEASPKSEYYLKYGCNSFSFGHHNQRIQAEYLHLLDPAMETFFHFYISLYVFKITLTNECHVDCELYTAVQLISP